MRDLNNPNIAEKSRLTELKTCFPKWHSGKVFNETKPCKAKYLRLQVFEVLREKEAGISGEFWWTDLQTAIALQRWQEIKTLAGTGGPCTPYA